MTANRGISEAMSILSAPLSPILQEFYLFCFNPDEVADPVHSVTPETGVLVELREHYAAAWHRNKWLRMRWELMLKSSDHQIRASLPPQGKRSIAFIACDKCLIQNK